MPGTTVQAAPAATARRIRRLRTERMWGTPSSDDCPTLALSHRVVKAPTQSQCRQSSARTQRRGPDFGVQPDLEEVAQVLPGHLIGQRDELGRGRIAVTVGGGPLLKKI